MTATDEIIASARACLPKGFLRRAREDDALLVTDCPRFCDARAREGALHALESVGFAVTERGGRWLIDLTSDAYVSLIRSLPPAQTPPLDDGNAQLRALVRCLTLAPTPPESQPVAPIRLTLKLIGTREQARLYALLPPVIAQCKRLRAPLPTAVASLLCQSAHAKEESLPC